MYVRVCFQGVRLLKLLVPLNRAYCRLSGMDTLEVTVNYMYRRLDLLHDACRHYCYDYPVLFIGDKEHNNISAK